MTWTGLQSQNRNSAHGLSDTVQGQFHFTNPKYPGCINNWICRECAAFGMECKKRNLSLINPASLTVYLFVENGFHIVQIGQDSCDQKAFCKSRARFQGQPVTIRGAARNSGAPETNALGSLAGVKHIANNLCPFPHRALHPRYWAPKIMTTFSPLGQIQNYIRQLFQTDSHWRLCQLETMKFCNYSILLASYVNYLAI